MNTFLNLQQEKASLLINGLWHQQLNALRSRAKVCGNLLPHIIFSRGISEQYNAIMYPERYGKRKIKRAKYQNIIRRIY